jgi:hypothetical protein
LGRLKKILSLAARVDQQRLVHAYFQYTFIWRDISDLGSIFSSAIASAEGEKILTQI